MEMNWKKAGIITGVASAMGAALYYLLQPAYEEESRENTVPNPIPKQTITQAPRQEIKHTPVQEPALNKPKLISLFNQMAKRLGERLVIPISDTYQARVHYRKKEVL
jgi:hypothetical protein